MSAALLAADASGTWTGSLTTDEGERPAHLILKQEGGVLTGTGGPGEEEQYVISKGTVGPDGAIAFQIERENGPMKFVLQLKGDEIAGTLSRERSDGGTQTATLKVKRRKQDLSQTVKALDAALFGAYNVCDLPKMRSYFAPEVEFYHDQGGLMTGSEAVMEATKNNICGKVRRELLSIEVYPIAGYGAIETGTHTFYNRSSGKEEGGQKAAKFLHIWREKGGEWQLTRVVSYAH